jgi:hypothetical protein
MEHADRCRHLGREHSRADVAAEPSAFAPLSLSRKRRRSSSSTDVLDANLTYADVAKMWDVPEPTWRWWVFTKRVPHVRLGARSVRFSAKQLAAHFAAKRSA